MRMRAVLLTRLAPLHAPELAGAPRPIESALRARRQGFGTLVLYLLSDRLFLAPHMAMPSTKRYKIHCMWAAGACRFDWKNRFPSFLRQLEEPFFQLPT